MSNTQNKHTPLPWQIKHMDIAAGYSNRADKHLYIESVPLKKKGFVGNIMSVGDKENAEFITRACNSHYELLTALNTIATQSTDPKAQALAGMAIKRAAGKEHPNA